MKAIAIGALLIGRSTFAQSPTDAPAATPDDKTLFTAVVVSEAAIAVPMVVFGVGEEAINPTNHAAANALGALGITALVLGPSAGHWYAGELVTPGLVLRATSMATFLGLAIYDQHLDATTIVGIGAAAGMYATGFIWDALTLPRAVRRFNREHAVAITPLVTANGPATGLSIGAAF